MKKNFDFFKAKETRLKTALEKVEAKLLFFKERSEKNFSNYDQMSEDEREEARSINNNCQWNEHHDLADRLKDRISDNWADYHEWHFKTRGWAAY